MMIRPIGRSNQRWSVLRFLLATFLESRHYRPLMGMMSCVGIAISWRDHLVGSFVLPNMSFENFVGNNFNASDLFSVYGIRQNPNDVKANLSPLDNSKKKGII